MSIRLVALTINSDIGVTITRPDCLEAICYPGSFSYADSDQYSTSVFMLYEYSAGDFDTVPPFEEWLDRGKLVSEHGKLIVENHNLFALY